MKKKKDFQYAPIKTKNQSFEEWWAENGDELIEKQRQRELRESKLIFKVWRAIKTIFIWIVGIAFLIWYVLNGGAIAQFW